MKMKVKGGAAVDPDSGMLHSSLLVARMFKIKSLLYILKLLF